VAVGTVLQSALIEVRANQPVMLAGVALFLLSIALVAALLPAARASRLDPVAALRQE
jgi:ABC-type lipoprotein release transport system permease subunit